MCKLTKFFHSVSSLYRIVSNRLQSNDKGKKVRYRYQKNNFVTVTVTVIKKKKSKIISKVTIKLVTVTLLQVTSYFYSLHVLYVV